jgi:hypothetical protein
LKFLFTLVNPGPASPDHRPRRWSAVTILGLAVAVGCALFVFSQMRPDLLLADTTPAGGDMGAHVWGPAFLRDHLLPSGRLSGWTPDWYAGFPAYQYYMVVPSLAIVALNAGFRPWFGVPLALLVIYAAFRLTGRRPRGDLLRKAARIAAPLAVIMLISMPYGISFKLVSVAGLVAFPLAAWLMAHLARSPEPVPAFAALAATVFLFDTNFSITGGNIASTLAGEFAFSISLTLALVAVGLAARGMDSGRGRALGAVVIGLIALCHIIPVFFAIVALIALVPLAPNVPRLWPLAVGIGLALIPVALADGTSTEVRVLSVGAALAVLVAVIATEPQVRQRARWMLVVGPVAVLIAAFWLVPFVLRHPYFNDMGWEPLTQFGPKMLTVPMKIALPLAGIGLVLSLASRERIGLVFSTTAVVAAAAVTNLPAGALWNERLLPFYYLSVYLAAAVGVSLVVRFAAVAITEDFARPHGRTLAGATLVGLVATIIGVGIPLRVLPFAQDRPDGTEQWLVFTSHARSFLPSWTAWNYSGYERKPAYREYHDIVATMAEVGQTNGCGRTMWEYSKDLDRYGTPMALMLLPFWTDGCLGSMEGLYFESSASTPFHFLNQSTLSDAPSRAQRDLPYQSFDINKGVDQLQVMGVRYYLAQTDVAIAAARANPELKEVAQAEPFVVFQVYGSDLVEGLGVKPVVTTGQTPDKAGTEATKFDVGWLGEAVRYYNNPVGFNALPAQDGPADWARVGTLLPSDGESVPAAKVSDIQAGTSSISFTVDQIGTPVLVKASYFPNWKAKGADGPFRAGPNLMVVVPTSTHVELSYGRTGVDWLATLMTLAGLGCVALLLRADRRPFQVRTAVLDGPEDEPLAGQVDGGTEADRLVAVPSELSSTGVGGARDASYVTAEGNGSTSAIPGEANGTAEGNGTAEHNGAVEHKRAAEAYGAVGANGAREHDGAVGGNGSEGPGDQASAPVDASRPTEPGRNTPPTL